ncbi:MAG: hypothetical protein RSE32_07760 [Comamonas sp.]|uniref:hypothetical protein n=1 Tax=Comamonas sp. TaxID=34028 RepID=UPI002FC6F71F
MHSHHLRWHRYRHLLAAVMTLPDLDVATPVLHEFSGFSAEGPYRMQVGGHSVAEDKICSRCVRSLELLPQAVTYAD